MAQVIGIDLGTTNSVVAFLRSVQPEVIANAEGGKLTPSVVLFRENEPALVGELAKRQLVAHPAQAVRSVKRLMGRRLHEVEELAFNLPYNLVPDPSQEEVRIVIDGRNISPVEISALILQKMRQTASDYLGEDVTQAVITVPAYFNDSQRQATKEAARQAGLEPLRIINEPTAAALAYGVSKDTAKRVAVFDFGGGTFDISILEIEDDVFEVLSTNGDTQLGGDNIDDMLANLIANGISEETGVDPSEDITAIQRIVEAAEKAKCDLSSLQSTTISLPFIVADASGPKHYSRELKREEFETLIQPVLDRLRQPCRQALNDAGLQPTQIEVVVLVGGSTRIPAVQHVVREIFGRDPVKTVNPDEAVALGAAIQGGIITGDIEEVLLLDVTPLSLGIEVEGGLFRSLIPRNSSVPVTVNRRFTTTRDNQSKVDVHVLQGERSRATENRTLAHLQLTGIAPAPAEVPEIDVSFSIDADGILSVTATDITSGSQNHIVVQSYGAGAASEIHRAIVDAESHVEDDKTFLELAQVKQRVAQLMHSMEALLETNVGDMAEDDRIQTKELLFRLDVTLHSEDLDAMLENEKKLLEIGSRYSEMFFVQRLGDNMP